jgi:tRNA dimethylallyltransferase
MPRLAGRAPSLRASVLALFGPTASGKTAVAELLADRIGGEVVSADSMQIYAGLPLLTAQPVRRTRLVAVWPLSKKGSVAEYARAAHAEIDALVTAARTPVVAGGTGLYLRAALGELELPPPPGPSRRAYWGELYDRVGGEEAHALLAERDPAAARRVHPNDRRRVVRALELAEQGMSLSPTSDRLWSAEMRHPTLVFGLDVPPGALAMRIEQRVRAMFDAGVENEVHAALAAGVSSTAAQALGLREIGEAPPGRAFDLLVARTRRYAAYQRKWMRRIPGLVSVDADRPVDAIVDDILEVASARERLPAR